MTGRAQTTFREEQLGAGMCVNERQTVTEDKNGIYRPTSTRPWPLNR